MISPVRAMIYLAALLLILIMVFWYTAFVFSGAFS